MDPLDDSAGHGPALCGALKRDGSGDRCARRAGHGTAHKGTGRCAAHGGNTPNHVKAGRRAQAEQAMRRFGGPVDGLSPEDALLDLVAATAGHVEWLRQIVAGELEPPDGPANVDGYSDLTWTSGRESGDTRYEVVEQSVWVQLYGQERDRLARYAGEAARIGIEERQVKTVERIGRMLGLAINAALQHVGADQHPDVEGAIRAGVARLQTGTP